MKSKYKKLFEITGVDRFIYTNDNHTTFTSSQTEDEFLEALQKRSLRYQDGTFIDADLPENKRRYIKKLEQMRFYLDMALNDEKKKALQEIENKYQPKIECLDDAIKKAKAIDYLESIDLLVVKPRGH